MRQEELFQDANKSRAGIIIQLTNPAFDDRLTATQVARDIDALVAAGYLERVRGKGLGVIYRTTPEGYEAQIRFTYRGHLYSDVESIVKRRVAGMYPELQQPKRD